MHLVSSITDRILQPLAITIAKILLESTQPVIPALFNQPASTGYPVLVDFDTSLMEALSQKICYKNCVSTLMHAVSNELPKSILDQYTAAQLQEISLEDLISLPTPNWEYKRCLIDLQARMLSLWDAHFLYQQILKYLHIPGTLQFLPENGCTSLETAGQKHSLIFHSQNKEEWVPSLTALTLSARKKNSKEDNNINTNNVTAASWYWDAVFHAVWFLVLQEGRIKIGSHEHGYCTLSTRRLFSPSASEFLQAPSPDLQF
ncbi:MAG: hypothetical protein V4629_08290 [Pseudomonadota bacterium]